MAAVTVNGVRLAYELHGQGEPIVLIPATGMMKEAWLLAGPAPALVDAGYRVCWLTTAALVHPTHP
jgi:pimeloyl-ACP methyl ester carboxylesterase